MDVSMTVCGFILALMGLTQVFTSLAYSRVRCIPKYQYMLLAAFLLQAVAITMFASDSLAVLTVGVGIMGVGLGLGMPTITTNLSMGIYSCLMNLGTSLSTVIMGPVIVAIGYTSSFQLSAVVVLLFGIAVLVAGRFLGQPEPATEA